jgi:hypothetical protein
VIQLLKQSAIPNVGVHDNEDQKDSPSSPLNPVADSAGEPQLPMPSQRPLQIHSQRPQQSKAPMQGPSQTQSQTQSQSQSQSHWQKPGAGLAEHVIALQQVVRKLGKEAAASEWSTTFNELKAVLSEKNLMHFMAGVDMCGRFVEAALQHQREFMESHLAELVVPIMKQQAD